MRDVTAKDVDRGGGFAQVVQVHVVVGRAHSDLVGSVGVVLHAAHVGAQLYACGGRCLLGGPGLRRHQPFSATLPLSRMQELA